tara:strand:+ start:463 stop:921 length:459 start_codon:yes stop_codon:yes gene_type:complete
MQIWVDADATPVSVREILLKTAERTKIKIIFVSNQFLKIPVSRCIKVIKVSSGFDVVDNYIIENMDSMDLVITSDIPLASEVLLKGGMALSTRGEEYTQENINQRLNMRDFMETMRFSGVHTGGPKPFTKIEVRCFANALDRIVTNKYKNRS